MPIHVPSDTLTALGGGLLPKCESRSLFQDRFADPQAREDDRKNWFHFLIGKKAAKVLPATDWHPAGREILYARLMARMMVNLGGGVMENANVLLDRYGLPVIPGSAVKACARRMALQALHDWIAEDPNNDQPEDICEPCRLDFVKPAHMLAAIARVFGWVGQDWDCGKKDDLWKSDFAWAVAGDAEVMRVAKEKAGGHDSFAGIIAFLPASPITDPGLELDVVTPHHTEYYKGNLETATDTEDPIPVFFPAVKPQKEGDYFTFVIIPLRRADAASIQHAKTWLRLGLETFGLGAKTNAGYGWFDASEKMQTTVAEAKKIIEKATAAQRNRLEEEARRKADEERRLRERAEEAAATEGMSEDEKRNREISLLTEAQFDAKVRAFWKEPKKGGPTEEQKKAIVRALRGPRLAYWTNFKTRATKGDLAKSEQAIRALNKTLHADKMP